MEWGRVGARKNWVGREGDEGNKIETKRGSESGHCKRSNGDMKAHLMYINTNENTDVSEVVTLGDAKRHFLGSKNPLHLTPPSLLSAIHDSLLERSAVII